MRLTIVAAVLVVFGAHAAAQTESRSTPAAEARPATRAFDPKRALEAARDLATGDPWIALAAYDDAITKLNAELVRLGKTQDSREISDLYRAAIAESDKLADRIETPEYEKTIRERDMLSMKERDFWSASPGIKYAFIGREMVIEGIPVENKNVIGVASIDPPASTAWHDLVLDIGFTVISGEFEMYGRYDPNGKTYRIGFGAGDGYEPDKSYRMTIRIAGNSIVLTAANQPQNRNPLDLCTSRTGGIGFGLRPGSKAILSTCKIKLLRTGPALLSTTAESKPGSPQLEALEAARGLRGRDPWVALAAYDDAIANIHAELVRVAADPDSLSMRDLYRQALSESGEIIDKVETPEYEAKMAERDMLAPEARGLWQSSAGVTHTFTERRLTIEGVAVEGKKNTSVCSFRSSTVPWHDVVIELEFTILSGGFELYLRYSPGARPYPIWLSPERRPPEGSPSGEEVWVDPGMYKLLEPYRVTVSVKGNELRWLQAGMPEARDRTPVDASRTGGIGFAVEPGAKVLITSCKLKVLR